MPESMPEQGTRVPEFYTDRMRVTVSLFGVNISFGLSEPHPDPELKQPPSVSDVVLTRMSLQHAKLVAMLLAKQIKSCEKETGTHVGMPREVIEELGLRGEAW